MRPFHSPQGRMHPKAFSDGYREHFEIKIFPIVILLEMNE